MKLISLWLLVVISFSITSCKKEDNNNNILPDNTNRITRFAVASVLPGGGVDTSYIRTFSWDASGRCTRIAINYVNSTADNYQIDNYYNGTDTIIAKRKFTNPSSPGVSNWEYFTYDASGRMIMDSLVFAVNSYSIYRYTTNTQGVITLNLNGPYTPILNATYRHNFDGAGNIINEIDSAFNYNISTGSFPFSYIAVTTASYDNKPNPLYKVYPKRIIQLDHENILKFDMQPFFGIAQKNNITQEMRGPTQPASGLPTYNHSATYQYNAAGYPTSVTFTDNENGEVLKGFYFY
jgi:hypothetical protein